MKIGTVELDNMTVLAPLAGITHLPFRLLAKQAGCALVYSEMVSAKGLIYKSKKTHELLESRPEEKPLSIQIFGSDPATMAEAAAIVEGAGADLLDINMGCPVKKVLKTGAGAALMKMPEQVKDIIQAVRKVLTIPLTIKIRSGWDHSGSQAMQIAAIAQDHGVDAVTLHPRTVGQGFRGQADWSLIAALKKHISLPVIGNGDIIRPQDALKMRAETGCDAVMIGRAAIGNPWIFSQVLALLRGEPALDPELGQRFERIERYLQDSINIFGEPRACKMMRSRLGWFVKGLPYSSRFRESAIKISAGDEAFKLIKTYRQILQSGVLVDPFFL